MSPAMRRLVELRQSVWYDYITRDLARGPDLQRLIGDGLRGMTSNPTIFGKAVAASRVYDDDLARTAAAGQSNEAALEAITVADVCSAADQFRALHDALSGDDGFVSIEVGPGVANDTQGAIREARRLWQACGRPNVMVKIPGTVAGVPAIRQCLEEGININITLLFSVARYRAVMDAYLSALEARAQRGASIADVHSVASFFVSRVDAHVDRRLDALAAAGDERAATLRGRAAIANARLAYQAFEETFSSPRFAALRARGARLQRPLWASTSSKDPRYPPLYYVEALVAPESVDTMPPETFAALRDHGRPEPRIHDDMAGSRAVLAELDALGIDLAGVAQTLEDEGVRLFAESYRATLQGIEQRRRAVAAGRPAARA